MTQAWVGKCILRKDARNKSVLVGRIVYVDMNKGTACYVPFPKIKQGRRSNYIPTPRFIEADQLAKSISTSKTVTLVDYTTPEHWLWTDSDIEKQIKGPGLRRYRRHLESWKSIRDTSYEFIRPFVEGRSVAEIVEDPSFSTWPAFRASQLEKGSKAKISRALNAYLLGLAQKGALMPWYIECGKPGTQKFTSTDTGRPSRGALATGVGKCKPNLSADSRLKLHLGWKRHKRDGASDEVALGLTRNEYFAKSIAPAKKGNKVTLKPVAYDISIQMFRYWGKKDPVAIKTDEGHPRSTPIRDEMMRRQNKARDSFDTLNGVAYIDSTSTDQTLISSIYPLKRLKSPWRTEVLAASIDYVFGIYVGFEAVSATTALLAILNAATDKVAMCARFGHTIEPQDWYSCTFNSFRADNGEGKGQVAMYTLEQMNTTASYGKAYDAINKAPEESSHRSRQKRVDHLIPATTMGRLKLRGEADRALIAGFRFDDYMHLLIKDVLYTNNKQFIDLPRLEMYPGVKERTRRGVVEWLIDHHYLSSAPTDLNVLRVMCLPRFDAVMHVDGIHIFVPGKGSCRVIRRLVYRNEFLVAGDFLEQSRRKARRLQVHMNPDDLSHIWANIGGLKRFELVTYDLDFTGITLVDWLAISEDDKLAEYLSRHQEIDHMADKLANIAHLYKAGKQARAKVVKEFGKPTKTEMRSDVRAMTELETALHTGIPPKSVPSPTTPGIRQARGRSDVNFSAQSTADTASDDSWLDIATEVYETQRSEKP